MTAAEELTKLETMYSAWIDAGCPQSYSINGRSLTKASFDTIVKRIDTLRASTTAATGGMCSAAQFRKPE
jgi:hypothetical protein